MPKHPKYRKIKAVTPRGEFEIWSAGEKDVQHFEVYYKDDPAWNKDNKKRLSTSAESEISQFKKRFEGMSFLDDELTGPSSDKKEGN